jgi:hypothetical protein
MNFHNEMFKYQEIQATANKIGEGIMNYFQTNFIKDDCISQMVGHCNRLLMNYSG